MYELGSEKFTSSTFVLRSLVGSTVTVFTGTQHLDLFRVVSSLSAPHAAYPSASNTERPSPPLPRRIKTKSRRP